MSNPHKEALTVAEVVLKRMLTAKITNVEYMAARVIEAYVETNTHLLLKSLDEIQQ